MRNGHGTNGQASAAKAAGGKGKVVTLDDVRDELRMSNRLMIASLAVQGVRQKHIAAVIDRTDSVVSEMFPKGLLRQLAQLSKSTVSTAD